MVHCRETDTDNFDARVGFTGHTNGVFDKIDLGCECCLWPIQQRRKNLSGLASVIIYGLFAHKDQVWLLSVNRCLQDPRHIPWIERLGTFD